MSWPKRHLSALLCLTTLFTLPVPADEMENPPGLVTGGGFRDRILPMPIHDGLESDGLWGASGVIPRDIHNGIEHPDWSYWGANPLLGDDGKYHMNICRWPEDAEKGHMSWQESTMTHVVADKPTGPYTPTVDLLYEHRDGKGHNPETIRLKDGRYMLHLWRGHVYLADSITGPWRYEGIVEVDTNGFEISGVVNDILKRNMTAVVRENGSILIVTKRGSVMIGDGNPLGPYKVVAPAVYPPQYKDDGPEDPVIWKGPVQWHLLYNRWRARKAVYMRSPDGIHWKHDPGIAYDPDITSYEDGAKTSWYKLERPHVLQDEHGRATHLSMAVIDSVKREDLPNDNHSSKNIIMPLVTPRLLEIVPDAQKLLVKIKAEPGFDPWRDIDVDSLRYGASERVNFGRGARPLASQTSGPDRILEFDRTAAGFTPDNFAGKLIGKTKTGDLILGWSRAPGFTDTLWAEIAPIYQQTTTHPFLTGLAAGDLARSRFDYYLAQDAQYLTAFSRALSILASKAPNEEWSIVLNKHAVECLEVERQLHESLLQSGTRPARKSPTNLAYTNHLLVSVTQRPFGEGLAAMLPCYWIYWEVGKDLKQRGSQNPDYHRWIEQYAGEEYGATVHQVLAIMNTEAGRMSDASRQQALRLFETSARYEYMFWDMAWREETWPPDAPSK